MPPSPVALMLMTWWELSTTKSFGAVIVDPDVVHVDASSSAMKASLKDVFTKPGYSSERNLKSKVRQLAPGWAARSTFSTVTSKSVLPRTLPPPRSVLAKAEVSGTEFTLPVVRMPKLEPWVGNSPVGVVDVPSGVPGATARNDAPVTVVDGAAIAWRGTQADIENDARETGRGLAGAESLSYWGLFCAIPSTLPPGSRMVASQRSEPSGEGPSRPSPPLVRTRSRASSMLSTWIHA